MVKISHECPIGLLHEVDKKWNDYCYALVHLFEEYPEYFKFMRDNVDQGRCVILDNSIFELGEAFDWKQYLYWIRKLEPAEYLVPDCLEETQVTISQFDEWMADFAPAVPKKCKTIGVVQGKTYEDLVKCYKYMKRHADKIAISFDYSYYDTAADGETKWHRFAAGRPMLIKLLQDKLIWDPKIPHHLLGVGLAKEYLAYQGKWDTYGIETIDTSNPVQQALLGHKYEKHGLDTKDSAKVADTTFKRILFTEEEKKLIDHNCQTFREIIHGE